MLFGILAPNDFGYPLYTVWYSCSQRFWLSYLCCSKQHKQDSQNRWEHEYQTAIVLSVILLLVIVLSTWTILFMLFGILAPNDFGYPVYAV
jgi:heme/copper-type cytochrome/quinol oxidase subunit 2